MRKAGEEQGVRWLQVMTAILLGGLLSLAVCLAVLLLCSIGISKGWLGETSMDKLAIVACVLGGFSGGVLTVKRCGSRALLSGLRREVLSFFCSSQAVCCSLPIRYLWIKGAWDFCPAACVAEPLLVSCAPARKRSGAEGDSERSRG